MMGGGSVRKIWYFVYPQWQEPLYRRRVGGGVVLVEEGVWEDIGGWIGV